MSSNYILNTPILTDWGTYRFTEISLPEAKRFLTVDFISAVGHAGTAEVLSKLLESEITANRVAITMKKGDRALVFRLLDRLPEGTVLNAEELAKLKYSFGLLIKVD